MSFPADEETTASSETEQLDPDSVRRIARSFGLTVRQVVVDARKVRASRATLADLIADVETTYRWTGRRTLTYVLVLRGALTRQPRA